MLMRGMGLHNLFCVRNRRVVKDEGGGVSRGTLVLVWKIILRLTHPNQS